MPGLHLNQRTLIDVRGPEAEDFLQNLVTCDVVSLPVGEVRPAALLTPQGKILFAFLISRTADGGFTIETDEHVAADLSKRLTLYKLRAKVEIVSVDAASVTVFWDEPERDGLLDVRFKEKSAVYRGYGDKTAADATAQDYDTLRIDSAVAVAGRDYALAEAFPHDVLFDLNGGVSFRKGCFVGQEVVSRMQHRGTARRRIVIADSDTALAQPGSAVEAGGRTVGVLGTVVGKRALALVRTDRVIDAVASNENLMVAGNVVRLRFAPWTGLSLEPAAVAGQS